MLTMPFIVKVMRIRRQSVAVLMISGFLFAQIVAVAHACPPLASHTAAGMQMTMPDGGPMPADCGSTTATPDPMSTAKACESHCSLGQQIDVHAVAWVAPLGLQPALTVRILDRSVPDALAASWLSSLSGAPPLSLLFGHFLI